MLLLGKKMTRKRCYSLISGMISELQNLCCMLECILINLFYLFEVWSLFDHVPEKKKKRYFNLGNNKIQLLRTQNKRVQNKNANENLSESN